MKKYILLLFILVFSFGLFNVNLAKADTSAGSLISDCVFSHTLRVGSRGAGVVCLQAHLGISADGKFGPKTKIAVKTWQAANGLSADGVFGPRSRANWVANGGVSGNFPEGCQSASGYSLTTGLACYPISSSNLPVISGVSGPQSLNVNEEGTWTVTAYDRRGGDLSYSVVWGDETSPAGNLSVGSVVQQTATFTHSYSQAGIYTPKFTVTSDLVCARYPCPNSASVSLSVSVGGIVDTSNFYVNPASATVKVGATAAFQALFNNCPAGAECFAGPQPVQATWTSSNPAVATVAYQNPCPVASDGLHCDMTQSHFTAVVTGVSQGIATITATYAKGSELLTATALVTVENEISQAPAISSISPSSGIVGSQVTVHGTGFLAAGNKLKFGNLNTENDPNYNLNSSDGETLVFTVPSSYYVSCLASIPNCEIATKMTQPGTYEISVINANGTSNGIKFVVTPSL